MDLDKEKTAPESEKKETGTEKIKQVAKQEITEYMDDKLFLDMKNMYGESEDSFIKGIRGNDEYAKKCQKMNDKEVLEFAKTDLDLKQYHARVIDKKINKPKEESKPTEKPAEAKKGPEKKPDDQTETPKEESKPTEKPADPKKEPKKEPDDKPEPSKDAPKDAPGNDKKEPKNKPEKKEGKGFWKTTGDVITYLPKQALKATKFTVHQTANLIKYPLRTTRSTLKFVWQYMDHGFSKVRREKNQGEYFSKWKWEQKKGK